MFSLVSLGVRASNITTPFGTVSVWAILLHRAYKICIHTYTHTYNKNLVWCVSFQAFHIQYVCTQSYIYTYLHTYIHTCIYTYRLKYYRFLIPLVALGLFLCDLYLVGPNNLMELRSTTFHRINRLWSSSHSYIHTYIHTYTWYMNKYKYIVHIKTIHIHCTFIVMLPDPLGVEHGTNALFKHSNLVHYKSAGLHAYHQRLHPPCNRWH